MNFKNRVLRIEKLCRNRMDRGEHDNGAEHDGLTADNLLRIWEGGADDWVRVQIEHVIEKGDGLNPAAKVCVQERLRILQTGGSLEILLVIAGLSGTVLSGVLRGQTR